MSAKLGSEIEPNSEEPKHKKVITISLIIFSIYIRWLK